MKKFSTKDGREIVIRTATEDDASMFLDFSKHIFERFDSFNSSSIEEFKNDLEVERQFIASHQSDNRVLLVAIHNDKIVEERMQARGSHEANTYGMSPPRAKEVPRQGIAHNARSEGMQEVCPEKARGGERKAVVKARFEGGNEEEGIFHCGESEGGGDHIDHRVNGFIEFGLFEDREAHRKILEAFLNEGNADQYKRQES